MAFDVERVLYWFNQSSKETHRPYPILSFRYCHISGPQAKAWNFEGHVRFLCLHLLYLYITNNTFKASVTNNHTY